MNDCCAGGDGAHRMAADVGSWRLGAAIKVNQAEAQNQECLAYREEGGSHRDVGNIHI